MKKTRRIAAFAAAMAMAATMAMPMAMNASAAYTVTITGNTQDKGTHTYGAYQILSGTVSSEGVLTDIGWGSGVDSTALLTALHTASADTESDLNGLFPETVTTPDAVAKAMANVTTVKAPALAAIIGNCLGTAENTGSEAIDNLAGGYYLIQDEASSPVDTLDANKPAAKTKYILRVLKDESVSVKSSVPSVIKKVQDINHSDETPALTGLQDSADYGIGEKIPYTLTATIGSGINNFDAYSFEFVDEMSAGLSMADDAWSVKIGTTDVTGLFTRTNDGNTYKWTATDIKNYATGKTLAEGDTVVLEYKAYLNSNAVIGSAGNPNTVYLKFDNNPNNCGKGVTDSTDTGSTPKDKNIVFTYKTIFNKVKEDGSTALTGADFKLEKKSYNATGDEVWTDVTTITDITGTAPRKTGSTAGSTFEFVGLDDGVYRLTETVTPSGYNSIDPIVFTITATHDVLADDPTLTALSGTGGATFTMTSDLTAGSLTANVVNESGTSLPITGGMGTRLFVLGGGCMAGLAGLYIVSKKRSKDAE